MRYIKRFEPTNIKPQFLPNDVIEFNLPNNIVDLSSLKIYYKGDAEPVLVYTDGTMWNRFLPRLSQSIIQELSISVDNTPIQSIKEFNYLFNILHDGSNKDDGVYSDKYDTVMTSYIDDDNNVKAMENMTPSLQTTYKYVIDKFIGFLNDVKYLDCRQRNVKISIKLAPKWITYRGLEDTSGTLVVDTNIVKDVDIGYSISDVSANIDIIPPDEYVQTQKSIEYEDFKHIKGNNEKNKNVYLSLQHKGKINYLLSTFTDAERYTDTGLQLNGANDNVNKYGDFSLVPSAFTKSFEVEYNLNNSLYFKRNGLNVDTCQYRCNGQDVTPMMNMFEMFHQARSFFGGKMERVNSLVSFQNDFFCFPMKIGKVDEDMINKIEFLSKSGSKQPNGGEAIMFLSYNKSFNF